MTSHQAPVASQPLTLKDLPTHLDLAAVSPLCGAPLADKQDCPICLQNFSTDYDVSDSTDPPCQPLLLHGCNHFLGSTCLIKLLQANMSACPLCRTPFRRTSGSNPLPLWLRWLLRTQQFPFSAVTLWINMARPALVSECDELQLKVREFDELHERLFTAKMDQEERMRLWRMYMSSPVTDTGMAVVFVVGVVGVMWAVECILRMATVPATVKVLGLDQKIPTFILGVASLFTGDRFATMPREDRWLTWPVWVAIALFTLSAICLARALPVWLLFLVTVSDCVVFGAVVWILIGIGMRKRRYW